MLIDVENVNQAESHKWVCHILKNIHGTCFIPNFPREINWEWSQICQVRGLQVMLIDVDNVNQAESQKWICHILKNIHDTCFIPNFSR